MHTSTCDSIRIARPFREKVDRDVFEALRVMQWVDDGSLNHRSNTMFSIRVGSYYLDR